MSAGRSPPEDADESTLAGDGGSQVPNAGDDDRPQCRRRCKDGSVCEKVVPLPGTACRHHAGHEPVPPEPTSD
jgi:hypothetical protein